MQELWILSDNGARREHRAKPLRVTDTRATGGDMAAWHVLAENDASSSPFVGVLYQAPVITYDERGEARFRYLRRYLESAHNRAGEPLTAEQLWALDVLDAVLDLSELQFRTSMEQGEVLIASDSHILHARTSFCDPGPGAPHDIDAAAAGSCRFFDRVWVRKRGR